MKKYIALLMVSATLIAATGCSNTAAKHFGGTMDLSLPKGQKLVNITWKENDLWTLTRPMTEEDVAETYEFKANTNFGIVEGKVLIKENK